MGTCKGLSIPRDSGRPALCCSSSSLPPAVGGVGAGSTVVRRRSRWSGGARDGLRSSTWSLAMSSSSMTPAGSHVSPARPALPAAARPPPCGPGIGCSGGVRTTIERWHESGASPPSTVTSIYVSISASSRRDRTPTMAMRTPASRGACAADEADMQRRRPANRSSSLTEASPRMGDGPERCQTWTRRPTITAAATEISREPTFSYGPFCPGACHVV